MFSGTEVTVNPGCIACTPMQQDLTGCEKNVQEGEWEQGMGGGVKGRIGVQANWVLIARQVCL